MAFKADGAPGLAAPPYSPRPGPDQVLRPSGNPVVFILGTRCKDTRRGTSRQMLFGGLREAAQGGFGLEASVDAAACVPHAPFLRKTMCPRSPRVRSPRPLRPFAPRNTIKAKKTTYEVEHVTLSFFALVLGFFSFPRRCVLVSAGTEGVYEELNHV